MGNFFGSVYNWFRSLYGTDLYYFLWGYDPVAQQYINQNVYAITGWLTLGISFALVLVYYYVFNHPRFCKWWSWLITLIVNSVIALFAGFGIVYSKYSQGAIPQDLMYTFDDSGNIVAYKIVESNIWGFGLANFFIAAIVFVIFSAFFKWGSSNAKHIPF